MSNVNRFAFQAPNPAALDPNALEQVYAQGAARRMGPAFNLVAQGLARGERQDSANAYLQAVGDLNQRAQEAGRMQLAQERLLELSKLGVDLAGKDMTFAGTPLAQYALTMGQGGSGDLLQALMQIGNLNNAARRTEQVGSGMSRLAGEGFRPPTGLTIDQLPFAPLTQGTPTSVMAAGAGNPSVKPQLVTKTDPNSGQVTQEYRVPLDASSVANIPKTPGEIAAAGAQNAAAAGAVRTLGAQEGGRFVDELIKKGVSISTNAQWYRANTSVGGQVVQSAPHVRLPNGREYAYANGTLVRVK